MTTAVSTHTDEVDSADEGPSPSCDAELPPERVSDPGLEVTCAVAGLDPDGVAWLRSRLCEAAAHLSRPLREVVVRVVDDAEMTRLHRRWHDLNSTTDVLSFPRSEPSSPIEADIAICIDEARRRAAERGQDTRRELLLYALHGLLHCAGYDDHQPDDFEAMHAEEDRILTLIGVGAVFGEPGGGCDA